ncbi:MAG: hypothetical protein ACE5LX_09090 [Nitrospinota bacterium]
MRPSGRSSSISEGERRKGRARPRALILDSEPGRRKRLLELLPERGFSVRALSDAKKLRQELLSRGAEVIFLGLGPGRGGFPSPRQCPPFTVVALEEEHLNFPADLTLSRDFGPRELDRCLSSALRLARIKRALFRARRLAERFRQREQHLRNVRHALNNLSMVVEGYLTLESMGHPSAKERASQVLKDQAGKLEFISQQLEQAMVEVNRKKRPG